MDVRLWAQWTEMNDAFWCGRDKNWYTGVVLEKIVDMPVNTFTACIIVDSYFYHKV